MLFKVFVLCFLELSYFGSSFSATFRANENRNFTNLLIEDGFIKGTENKTNGKGIKYYAFLGIPYAKPPLDQLRFEPPEKNKKWTGIWDATKDRSGCVQGFHEVVGSEDCLHINVYTPNLNGNLSVLVWIHGGGFDHGNSSYVQYGPDHILDHEVIFVSFNYRVGVFGFLSTADMVVPGNAGLKDQSFALKWVQRNIKYFGGDPNRVTIFGESAGAASVSYQVQSKLSKGLFRAAIMQSGNSLCLWSLNRRAKRIALQTGIKLGLDVTSSKALAADLKKVEAYKLHTAAYPTAIGVALENPLAGIMFSPVMEPCHEGAFFCNQSDVVLGSGDYNHVPVIIGVNSMEAAIFDDIPGVIRIFFPMYDVHFSKLAPADLNKISKLERNLAGIDIKVHYFGIVPLTIQTQSVVQFVSDDQFNRPTRRTAIHMSKYNPVYLYKFSHIGLLGNGKNGVGGGVGHGEDLGYFFNSPKDPGSSEDKVVREKLITLWTNFCKHLKPTPKVDPSLDNVTWPTTGNDPDKLVHLDISYNLSLATNFFEENMKFYDKVYTRYGAPPYDTY